MGMTVSFLILAMITLAGGVAAMTLRRLVHCALALAVSFAGLAGLYLNLGAEFAGLAQLLVYVGAIAILIVFAILLTRSAETEVDKVFSPAGLAGGVLAAGRVRGVGLGGDGERRGTPFEQQRRAAGVDAGDWLRADAAVRSAAGGDRADADGGDDRRGDSGGASGPRQRTGGYAGAAESGVERLMTPLAGCLLVSSLLFSIGLAGALTRRNAILVLAGIELMLNAANLNFIDVLEIRPSP